jgi:hypothetical protein
MGRGKDVGEIVTLALMFADDRPRLCACDGAIRTSTSASRARMRMSP